MQTAFSFYTETKQAWLDDARYAMHDLLKRRAYVTSDDIHVFCPLPRSLHRNTMGSVFNSEFKSIGFTKSRREAANGRIIQMWIAR